MRGERFLFSTRTAWDREQTALTLALRERAASGLPLHDLTASNPTRCGFRYEPEAILAPLGSAKALDYEPEPFGMGFAREAVCAYYHDHSARVATPQVCLTTSTSEAYSYLFRLLCDPGDEVLIAQPSYPLFDFLAALDNISLVTYPLVYDHGWLVEPGSLRARISPRTRAVLLVHPNNPTGHFTSPADRAELELLCVEHGLALIVDEVFLDYPLDSADTAERRSFAMGPHPALTFVLSGLSKVAALPQMKAAWIATFGPEAQRNEALERLELVADTFLSMNAPAQHALPFWLAERGKVQAQIRARVAGNLKVLDDLLLGAPAVRRLDAEAGWYAVLRVPALLTGEALAVALVREAGVSVHPGYFYGFAGAGWLVVSLLGPAEEFEAGVRALLAFLGLEDLSSRDLKASRTERES